MTDGNELQRSLLRAALVTSVLQRSVHRQFDKRRQPKLDFEQIYSANSTENVAFSGGGGTKEELMN